MGRSEARAQRYDSGSGLPSRPPQRGSVFRCRALPSRQVAITLRPARSPTLLKRSKRRSGVSAIGRAEARPGIPTAVRCLRNEAGLSPVESHTDVFSRSGGRTSGGCVPSARCLAGEIISCR